MTIPQRRQSEPDDDPVERARTEAGRRLAKQAIDSMTAAGMSREDAEKLVVYAQDVGRAMGEIPTPDEDASEGTDG